MYSLTPRTERVTSGKGVSRYLPFREPEYGPGAAYGKTSRHFVEGVVCHSVHLVIFVHFVHSDLPLLLLKPSSPVLGMGRANHVSELHFGAESYDQGTPHSPADIGVVLNNGLQKKHR
jgi:hypothetical protein